MNVDRLIEQYQRDALLVRDSLRGLTRAQHDAAPSDGTWSIRQIICHLADAELLYAERMKRIIAEDRPMMARGEPTKYLSSLAVESRVIDDELDLIESIRRHLKRILRSLSQGKFERIGIHSTDGPMTLLVVLERAVAHIPHHLEFLAAKKKQLLAPKR